MTLRRSHILLGSLVALAAVLRFATLDVQSFWSDEASTADLLHRSLPAVFSRVADGESTPPLYYVLAWTWAHVFGTGEAGLRALSAVFGTLLVLVAWWLGQRLAPGHARRAGALAALLVATNPLLVWFSQEARAYALLVLLVALSVAVLLWVLEAPSRGRLLAWGAVAALALATHYFAVFFVAAEAVWLVAALGVRAAPAALALPLLTAGALAPLALAQRNADRAGFIRAEPFGTRLAQIPKQFIAGYDAPAEVVVTVLAAVGVIAALVSLGLRAPTAGGADRRALARLAAAAGLSLLLPAILAALGNDYVITRNVVATLAAVLVLAGVGLALVPRRGGVAVGGALAALWVTVVVCVAANPALQRDDWRSAADALGPAAVVPRAVVVTPGSGRVPALLYLPGARVAGKPGQTFPLQEISVLAVAAQQGPKPRSTPPVPAVSPIPGFAPAGGGHGKTWRVVRFRAAQPIAVDAASLSTGGAVVLLQGP